MSTMNKYERAVNRELGWLDEDLEITNKELLKTDNSKARENELKMRRRWALDEKARLIMWQESTHKFTGMYEIVWHDLTEDPNDLPENDMNEYLVRTRDVSTGELERSTEYRVSYSPEYHMWIDDEYRAFECVYALTSYGLKKIDADIYPDLEETGSEVVAWAEECMLDEIPVYVPAIFVESHKVEMSNE